MFPGIQFEIRVYPSYLLCMDEQIKKKSVADRKFGLCFDLWNAADFIIVCIIVLTVCWRPEQLSLICLG